MDISTQNKVEEFLADIQFVSREQYEMLVSVRKHFLEANSNVAEGIKYGGLVFNLANALIGGVFAYKNHISVEFSQGATFDDPDGLLQGSGKHRRHMKLNQIDDIDDRKLSYLISQAIAGD